MVEFQKNWSFGSCEPAATPDWDGAPGGCIYQPISVKSNILLQANLAVSECTVCYCKVDHYIPYDCFLCCISRVNRVRWRDGAISRTLDLRLLGRGFESCVGTIAQWPWASYLHLCASVTKQYNLVPVKGRWRSEAGKVTVGLATHWPWVTDFVVYPPTGSSHTLGRWALRPSSPLGTASLYLFISRVF